VVVATVLLLPEPVPEWSNLAGKDEPPDLDEAATVVLPQESIPNIFKFGIAGH